MSNFSHPFSFSLSENQHNSHYPQSSLKKKKDKKTEDGKYQTEAAMLLRGNQATRMPNSVSPWHELSRVKGCALFSSRTYYCEGLPNRGEKSLHTASPTVALLFSVKQVATDRILAYYPLVLVIYFGKTLLHAYEYLFMFPKLWPSHDVLSTFCAWICYRVSWLSCYFKSCSLWLSPFTKTHCRLVKKEASFRCISPALLTTTTGKKTIYNQEGRTAGFPAAASNCTAVVTQLEESSSA